ncbi:MAG: hypothetical protein KDH94_06575, partial [Coxiellaceae bacterium]|nr:hypothetical protein [Coxiellaceae bacterium]
MDLTMRLSIKILLLLSLFLCLPQAYSQNYATKADKIIFNLDAANKKFDKISLKLSTQDLKKNDLEIAMKQLEVLQSQAKECVTIAETQLKGINELLKSIPNTNPTNDHKYLLKRKAEYEKHFSECRLFVFRSQEAITAYKDTIAKLSATNIIQRSTPIWEIPITITKADLEKINWAAITTNIGINALDKLDLITLVTLIILGLALSFYLRNLCKSTVHQVNETHNLIKSFLRSARTYIIPIVIFGLISLFFYIINGKTAPKLEALSYTF